MKQSNKNKRQLDVDDRDHMHRDAGKDVYFIIIRHHLQLHRRAIPNGTFFFLPLLVRLVLRHYITAAAAAATVE